MFWFEEGSVKLSLSDMMFMFWFEEGSVKLSLSDMMFMFSVCSVSSYAVPNGFVTTFTISRADVIINNAVDCFTVDLPFMFMLFLIAWFLFSFYFIL